MNKRIIILGGMGPQASLELHRRLIARAAEAGASDNEDYPEILHISVPVPDFISSSDSSSGLWRIKQSLDNIKLSEDDQVILACNTAHLLLPELEAYYGIHFVSFIEVVIKTIEKLDPKAVGLLASPTTIKEELYGSPIGERGLKILLPTAKETDKLEHAIRHVITNRSPREVRGPIETMARRMLNDGAEQIILGCTELSVIFKNSKSKHLVDPLDVVCRELI